jgi:methyl-accepting chemotaxis protein
MFNSWTFGRRLAAGFGLAGLALLIIAITSYRATGGLVENNAMVSHSHQVQDQFAGLVSELKDAETGQRGYVITGEESYLTPYRAALAQVPATLQKVRQLTADNANQQQRLTALAPLIDAKLAELKQTIDLRRSEGFDAATKVVKTNAGKTTMDNIRTLTDQALNEEDRLLAQRTQQVEASARGAMAVTLWGGVAGVILVALIGWFITRSVSQQIGSAVVQIQSSSAELQAAATQQATGAQEQSAATSEITTTISELLATSRQIAESAQRVAQIAEQTAGAAHAGHGMVDVTSESISGIRRQVDQIVADMLRLGKKSQEIGAVVDIVSELAEQTNILAINATIEATGAGEAGARFGVVADEIRKLADRVGGSTKEIRTLIDDVRSAVNTTVMATETGSKAVDAGARQFGEVTSAFSEISSLVTTTTEAAREIELSTKQQSTAVEQVNIAIVNVAQASKETEASSGQTLSTASQLAVLSKELLRIIRPAAG